MLNKTLISTLIWLVILCINGCIPIPYKVKNPIEKEEIEEVRKLENPELREHLGQPIRSYEFGGNTYQIYEYPPGSDVFPLMHPIGYLFIGGLVLFIEGMERAMGRPNVAIERDHQVEEEWASACLMIVFENTNIIDAETKPYEKHGCEEVFREQLIVAAAEAREKGDQSAAFFHAVWTDDIDEIRRIAERGHLDAAIELAEKTGNTKPLKKLATGKSENTLKAAVVLKRLTGDDSAIQRWINSGNSMIAPESSSDEMQNGNSNYADLRGLAELGDTKAMLELFWSIQGPERLRWLCRAADQESADAQYRVGFLYRHGQKGFPHDPVRAYMWFRVASNTGHHLGNYEAEELRMVMTEEQFVKAEEMLEKWQPGQCIRDLVYYESTD